jgi:hypothetical protein
MIRPFSALAIGLCVSQFASAGIAAPPPRIEVFRHLLLGGQPYSSWHRVDLDGLPPHEFAALLNDSGRSLVVARFVAGQVHVLASHRLVDNNEQLVVVEGIDGPDRLALVGDARVRIFSGASAEVVTEFALTPAWQPGAVAIADVDADGDLELLRTDADSTGLEVRELASGLVLWNLPLGLPYQLKLAQLDDDPALEVVVSAGFEGLVRDGVAGASEWQYAGGFGEVLVGDVDGDGLDEVVGLQQFTGVVYDSQPYAPVAEFAWDNFGYTTPLLFDADGNGRDDLWTSRPHASGAAAVAHSVPAAELVASVSVPASSLYTLQPGRFGGDDGLQLLWAGTGLSSVPPTGLTDVASGRSLLELPPWGQLPRSVALVGVDRLVAAGSVDQGDPAVPMVQLWDLAGQRATAGLHPADLYTSDAGFPDVWTMAAGQLDGDAAPEVVVAGSSGVGSWATALDGATLLPQWHYLSEPFDYTEARSIAVGSGQVALGVRDGSGSRLRSLDAVTGSEQWSSISMPAMELTGVHAGDLDQDGNGDITLLADNGTWSYAADGSFGWSLPLAALKWHAVPGAAELLTMDWSGMVQRRSVPDGTVLDDWQLSETSGYDITLLAPVGDGYLLAAHNAGKLVLVDASTGALTDTGLEANTVADHPWAIGPTRHRTEQQLVLATGFGVTELRVLSPEHVFGGSSGGFE